MTSADDRREFARLRREIRKLRLRASTYHNAFRRMRRARNLLSQIKGNTELVAKIDRVLSPKGLDDDEEA